MTFLPVFIFAQADNFVSGVVIDKATNKPLQGAGIKIYSYGKISGNITNESGKFDLHGPGHIDSIEFSMIGYYNKTLTRSSIADESKIIIMIDANPIRLVFK